ncbi:hypothetical protein ACFU93_32420 [Streptomyces sp. NPDC057611]|uniref:hypothetical protein n=1 Tax=Streptomyces sp. NPDC057611 TaxID=3346182 RepID=UPI0036BB65DB
MAPSATYDVPRPAPLRVGPQVVVLAGATYTAATRRVWPDAAAPLEGAGGMGYQLQRLKALRETPTPLPPDPPPHRPPGPARTPPARTPPGRALSCVPEPGGL